VNRRWILALLTSMPSAAAAQASSLELAVAALRNKRPGSCATYEPAKPTPLHTGSYRADVCISARSGLRGEKATYLSHWNNQLFR
jgi:hypothetical protein